ncbi:VOC family protein [Actinomadura sp. 3N407]|uniref:VOC family protein n=1 Tax=Actinomadura sp. 3N407 TaxID=3457423 RepID=UPI003FCE4FCD
MCLLTAFFAPRTVTSPRNGPDGSICHNFSFTRAAYGVRDDRPANSPRTHALRTTSAHTQCSSPHVTRTVPPRQRAADHRPPPWPDPASPRRLHLDFSVEDLEQAEAQALAIGAVLACFQARRPAIQGFLDPTGHPFCIAITAAAAVPDSPESVGA